MKFAILTSSPSTFASVAECLSSDDVICVRFNDALALLRAKRTEIFDFMIIDANLFATTGRLVLSWRECNVDVSWPTLVFGRFLDRAEMEAIFDAGIDDLVTDQFTAEELHARVRRILRCTDRKAKADVGDRITVGPYRLCKRTRIATLHDRPIRLTAREFAMAWFLFSSPGISLPRQRIASAVWGTDASIVQRTLEQHVYKLRKKLCFGEANGIELKAIYSRGYQLAVRDIGSQFNGLPPDRLLAA